MNIEEARVYCLSLLGVTESFPFDDVSLVFKVEDKMFALLPLDVESHSISVKCDPDLVEDLRIKYSAVSPAFHFNKKYWNSILLESDMDDKSICKWIKHSYYEVIKKLPKYKQKKYLDE